MAEKTGSDAEGYTENAELMLYLKIVNRSIMSQALSVEKDKIMKTKV